MWSDGVWDWVIVGVLYAIGIGAFQLLGGFAAAGRAIQRWGRAESIRRAKRMGLGASSSPSGRE
jgi:hypothetical protein